MNTSIESKQPLTNTYEVTKSGRAYLKCPRCRRDRKSCVPSQFSSACERCQAKRYGCGPRERANPSRNSQAASEAWPDQVRPNTTTQSASNSSPQNLACPFLAAGPDVCPVEMRESCLSVVMKDISALKQHLARKHTMKASLQCPRCGMYFGLRDELNRHLATCVIASDIVKHNVHAAFMTDEAAKMIQSRQRGLDPLTAWQGIFKILFPGRPVPNTIYAIYAPGISTFSEAFAASTGPAEAAQLYSSMLKSLRDPTPASESTRDVIRDAYDLYRYRATHGLVNPSRQITLQDSTPHTSQFSLPASEFSHSNAISERLGMFDVAGIEGYRSPAEEAPYRPFAPNVEQTGLTLPPDRNPTQVEQTFSKEQSPFLVPERTRGESRINDVFQNVHAYTHSSHTFKDIPTNHPNCIPRSVSRYTNTVLFDGQALDSAGNVALLLLPSTFTKSGVDYELGTDQYVRIGDWDSSRRRPMRRGSPSFMTPQHTDELPRTPSPAVFDPKDPRQFMTL